MTLTSKLKHFWRVVKTLFNDYAEHSTIHGVSYMNEKKRSRIEKLWWIVVFVMLVLCCGKMISDAWNIKPIIISFTEKPTSIEQVCYGKMLFHREENQILNSRFHFRL
jgi:Amiloride-sensitive sodium channel